MALFDTTRTNFGRTGLTARTGGLFATIAASYTTWNDARMTRNALSGLTDRELDDIGLVRGDIDIVAEGRVNR